MVLQKGFDIFADSINELMGLDAQWIILGSGDNIFESLFRQLSNQLPGKVGAYIGYNDELSHLIEAGSDMFLMPSQIRALRVKPDLQFKIRNCSDR